MSIRLRLTLWYSGILSVTLLLFGFGLYLFLSFYIYNDLEKQLGRTWTETYERIKPLAAPRSGEGFRSSWSWTTWICFRKTRSFSLPV